ncbi:MAG: omptin family outer membrane protease [Thermodesulfobacteriota bacterium]|nr:omptin family outer membrane protease [Thermodesulfobacteriota bacterium]
MKHTVFALLMMGAIIFSGLPAAAGDLIDTDISVGIARLHGDTTYRIGGLVQTPTGTDVTNSPLSELSFPLEIFMMSVNTEITVADRLALLLSAGTGLTDDTRDMQDSDWEWEDSPITRTTYSESSTELDALTFSGRLRYRIFNTHLNEFASHTGERYDLGFWAGVGYLHKEFEFAASDTYQTSRVAAQNLGLISGPTLTYDITYTIPYMELAATLNVNDKTDLNVSVGYTPYAKAEDEDHHLLRNMTARGDGDGDATLLSIDSRFALTEHWFTGLTVDYCYVETEGESVTYVNNAWAYTINEEMESEHTTISIKLGCRF